MACAHDGLFVVIQTAVAGSPALSAKELAVTLGCCRQTIAKAVRRNAGTSFRHWSATYRWEAALNLLREQPSLSLTSIGRHIGYSTVQAFDHAFRRRFGISPGQFRAAATSAGLGAPCPDTVQDSDSRH